MTDIQQRAHDVAIEWLRVNGDKCKSIAEFAAEYSAMFEHVMEKFGH